MLKAVSQAQNLFIIEGVCVKMSLRLNSVKQLKIKRFDHNL